MKKRGYYIELVRTDGEDLENLSSTDLMVEAFVDSLKVALDTQVARGTLKLFNIDEPDMYVIIKPEAFFQAVDPSHPSY